MNKIKAVLDAKGIKQTWLADKLGMLYRYKLLKLLHNYEIKIPTISEVIWIERTS